MKRSRNCNDIEIIKPIQNAPFKILKSNAFLLCARLVSYDMQISRRNCEHKNEDTYFTINIQIIDWPMLVLIFLFLMFVFLVKIRSMGKWAQQPYRGARYGNWWYVAVHQLMWCVKICIDRMLWFSLYNNHFFFDTFRLQ